MCYDCDCWCTFDVKVKKVTSERGGRILRVHTALNRRDEVWADVDLNKLDNDTLRMIIESAGRALNDEFPPDREMDGEEADHMEHMAKS